jgi:protein phosphatase 1 regulatory subunit 7
MIGFRRDRFFGKRELVYGGPGGGGLKLLLRATGVRSLVLKRAAFSGSSIEFLRTFSELEGLTIIDWKLTELQSLQALSRLRKLHLHTPMVKKPLNLTAFSGLEDLALDPAGTGEPLEHCVKLRKLFTTRLKRDELASLNKLKLLEEAEFSEPAFTRIGAVDLPSLTSLVFKAVRQLQDWNGLEGLPRLQKFFLFGAPQLKSLEPFRQLKELRWLLLEDCGRIDSVVPLCELKHLEVLNIIGNTRIMDGALASLKSLPSLRKVTFPARASYDTTEQRLNAELAQQKR